jgi:hypothetical protein
MLVGLLACHDGAHDAMLPDEPRTLEIVPTTVAPARPCGRVPELQLTDVRREPVALAADRTFLYWVDAGHFGSDTQIADGGLWRMPLAGGAPEQLLGDLDTPSSLIVTETTILIADSVDHTEGIRVVPKAGGPSPLLWRGGRVKLMAMRGDDLYFVVEDPRDGDSLHRLPHMQLPDAAIDARVGYADALATTADGVAIGGLRSGDDIDHGWIVTPLAASTFVHHLVVAAGAVKSIVADGASLYFAEGRRLLALDSDQSRATVRASASFDITSVRVTAHELSWIASRRGGFSLVVSSPSGDVIVIDRPEVGWQHLVAGSQIFWVESTPVADRSTAQPTAYRFGRVAHAACD